MKAFRRLAVSLIASAMALVLLTGLAFAVSHGIDEVTYTIAKKLNCPTCAGRSLAECGTATCYQWKQDIQAQLEAGKTTDEVLNYFKSRFGPTVLQEPPKEGGLLALWVLPPIGFVLLVTTGILVVRHVSRRRVAQVVSPASSSNEEDYREQIERQVREIS